MSHNQQQAAQPSSSRTQVVEREASPGVLAVRGAAQDEDSNVRFTEEVVDNEHMDKKKSKICCIYHPPAEFGESSEEESCGSDDSGPESDEGDVPNARKPKKKNKGKCGGHRDPSPNAYERKPRPKKN